MLAPDYPHGPPAASRPRTEDIRTAEETLKGRVVLVTGAGSGIGRAAALHMAKLGAKVLVADHNVSGLQRTQAEMAKAVADGDFERCIVLREKVKSIKLAMSSREID